MSNYIYEKLEQIRLSFSAYTPPISKNYDGTPLTVTTDEISTFIDSISSNKRHLDKNLVNINNANYVLTHNSITQVGSITPVISYNPNTIQIIYNNEEDITTKTTITFHSRGGDLTINVVPIVPPPIPGDLQHLLLNNI